MRDYQRELEDLREQIARRREDTAVLNRLLKQEVSLRETTEFRRTEWDREHRDVERMERVSLSSVWASLRGTKEEDLRREKAEEQAALLKLQEAERQLEEVRAEIRHRQDQLWQSGDCERLYEAILREKEREYRAKDPSLAAKLAELEQRKLDTMSLRRELQEALDAGRQALGYLQSAGSSLDSAAGWSTWDVLGGGLISDAMKYSHMDSSQRLMESAQSSLRRYRAELADVAVSVSFDLQPGGLTRTMDIFFDNIFSDWAVRDRIEQTRSQLFRIMDQVKRIQARLELDLDGTKRTLEALEQEWKELIANA